jgi:hypothetical protein
MQEAFTQALWPPSRKLPLIRAGGLPCPWQFRNRELVWVAVGQEEPLRSKLCYSHCFYSNMNLCSLMQICWEIGANLLQTKEFWSEQTKFEMRSLAFLVAILSICLFPHPPRWITPKGRRNFEENFLGCLPVTEDKESPGCHMSRLLK